jgi:glyoxylase-like metal-dependent hydrolase (beta-lactamase superfamily II)/predicted DCC family thiol-disulfide oxidoreductase YuxK
MKHFQVFYDAKCEVCQAGVAWLRLLDRRNLVEPVPLDPIQLKEHDERLDYDHCQRELHVLCPDGKIYAGWDAITALAENFPSTKLIGLLGKIFPFSILGRNLYRLIARNRYALSKCRGGSCPRAREDFSPGAFWFCHLTATFISLPLRMITDFLRFFQNLRVFLTLRGKQISLLKGRLRICFLNGWPYDFIPLVFNERFAAILYDGALLDPGSTLMRAALSEQLPKLASQRISKIIATHHHEEHVGNLNWAADRLGCDLFVSKNTERLIRNPESVPFMRKVFIGQPPPLRQPYRILGTEITCNHSRLLVLPAPGHCADQIALYDPKEKILFAGDSIMGEYFFTPNYEVDVWRWLRTLKDLSNLEIDILVEAHGYIYTLRDDIPDLEGLVIRLSPKNLLETKMRTLHQIGKQALEGSHEGLPMQVIEASCFSWMKLWAADTFMQDWLAKFLSKGEFSRTNLVASFINEPQSWTERSTISGAPLTPSHSN